MPKAIKVEEVEARTWVGTCKVCHLYMEAEEWTLKPVKPSNEGRPFNCIRCDRCGHVTEMVAGKFAVESLWE